jgi:hypothetical protein
MASSPVEPVDLLDLQLLPAWVKESPETRSYAHSAGDEDEQAPRRPERPMGLERGRQQHRPNRRRDRPRSGHDRTRDRRQPRNHGARQDNDRQRASEAISERIAVRFLPHPRVLQNVVEQIKSNTVAYSIFSLARLFLEKPERYEVCLTPTANAGLYQLGESGALSADRQFLEINAFRLAQADFYNVEVKQSDPIKGNFSGVARCRLSGVLLGPTNHHGYQPKLRTLYEQRFSRRMSFSDYQRQIEIVTDPAVVEQWKEEARNISTFTTSREASALTFGNVAEAERHFRQNYLPSLVRTAGESIIGGVASRQMPDRVLRRLIETAWSHETRSPSQMMQAMATSLREAGLHIFRQRRGMLFVSPIRVRPFVHDQTGVSSQVKAILETLTQNPRANRKELADKLLSDATAAESESRKLGLASDLHWLIREGYVIEFNDGSLDLPRAKSTATKPSDEKQSATAPSNVEAENVTAAEPATELTATVVGATTATNDPPGDPVPS